jgi:hypothetical protein
MFAVHSGRRIALALAFLVGLAPSLGVASPPASAPPPEPSDRTEVHALLVVDRAGLSERFVEALVLRTDAAIVETEVAGEDAAPPADTAYVVVTRREDHLEILVVLRDGRAWRRAISIAEVGEGELLERATATSIANLIAAIADEGVVPDDILTGSALPWVDLGYDEGSRRPVPDSVAPPVPVPSDRAAPQDSFAARVERQRSPERQRSGERAWIGVFVEPMTLVGLGPPRDGSAWAGSGAAVAARWSAPRGLVIGGRARLAGAGRGDLRLVRGQVAAQLGGEWRLGRPRQPGRRWNVRLLGQVGVEPWRGWLLAGEAGGNPSPVFIAPHLGVSAGLAWSIARGRHAAQLGLAVGAEATWATPTRAAFGAWISSAAAGASAVAAPATLRVGGMELVFALEVGWRYRLRK